MNTSSVADTVNPEPSQMAMNELGAVRASGLVNMMSVRDVRIVALASEYAELVAFCEAVQALPRTERAKVWTATLYRMGIDR